MIIATWGWLMAVDAKDLGALEKALNDAAGKASVLWTTFVTFELYLAIAFGAVTHRDLFLEKPVKLPSLFRGRPGGIRDLPLLCLSPALRAGGEDGRLWRFAEQ